MAIPQVFKNYREFLLGLGFLALVLTVFAIAAAVQFGRRTANDDCLDSAKGDGCFCESIVPPTTEDQPLQIIGSRRRAAIKQPWNTWSNAGFVAFGLAILWWLGWEHATGRRPPYSNRMTMTGSYSVTYGLMTIFMGPGAMFFHASLKEWGGLLDHISMDLFMGYVLAFNIVRIWDLSRLWFYIVYGASVLAGTLLVLAVPTASILVFAGLGGLAAIAQTIYAGRDKLGTATSGQWWFFVGGTSFLVAFVIWFLSWTGGPLCDPRGFQGHGVWHVLSAFTVFCLWKYFRAESRVAHTLPLALRIMMGIVFGSAIAAASTYGALAAMEVLKRGNGRLVLAIVFGVLGGTYATIALAYNTYRFKPLSVIGFLLDLSWSLPNTVLGLGWMLINRAAGGSLQQAEAHRRSGTFVLSKNIMGFPGITVGPVVAGTWASHEELHTWQCRILGPGFFPIYLAGFVLNVVSRLLTFRIGNFFAETTNRICLEDWAFWGGSTMFAASPGKLKWGGWIGGFFLTLLFATVLGLLVAGIAGAGLAVLIVGIVTVFLYGLIRAIAPASKA